MWDDVDEIKRKLSIWRPLQSDRLNANMRGPSSEPRRRRMWREREEAEKGDDGDDNKTPFDIRLSV